MDTSNFHIWNLFQVMCTDGTAEIMSFNLLYASIVVFALLIVGLVLTVLEFKKLNNEEKVRNLELKSISNSNSNSK